MFPELLAPGSKASPSQFHFVAAQKRLARMAAEEHRLARAQLSLLWRAASGLEQKITRRPGW